MGEKTVKGPSVRNITVKASLLRRFEALRELPGAGCGLDDIRAGSTGLPAYLSQVESAFPISRVFTSHIGSVGALENCPGRGMFNESRKCQTKE
jgi:hypothetical protein